MVRAAAIASSVLLALGTAAAAAPTAFQYREVATALTLADAKSAGLIDSCGTRDLDGTSLTRCHGSAKLWNGGVAGEDLYGTVLWFDADGLIGFDLSFRQHSLPSVKTAFTAKYGKPCRSERATLQNAFGAKFSQQSDIYCFGDGTLWLSRYDEDYLENSSSTFRATRFTNRRSSSPKVNF